MRALLVLTAACSSAMGHAPVGTSAVPPPAGCVAVAAGASLQAALDGDAKALCLAPGRYAGPVRITRPVTVWGPRDAVIAGGGTIVAMTAGSLLGVTVDGEGGSFDALDAAVAITGSDVRVEGVEIVNAVYGVLAQKSARVAIIGNHIRGDRETALGLRGDTIRLWETKDSVVADNVVEDGRDVVVWYSRGNRIERNRILRGRYGAHLMYSHDNIVRGNELRAGVVGVFAMYSRGVTLEDNTIAEAAGAAGMAIGLKESGNLVLARNTLVHDAVGIYIDTSPLQLTDSLEIRGNTLAFDQTAIVFHASGHRMTIADNDLIENDAQVRVDGGGSAVDVDWRDNYFDDYVGYDLDNDGRGDVAYELRSASGQLISEHPAVAVFLGTPAIALVDAASHLDPLFPPALVLRDPRPRMEPHR